MLKHAHILALGTLRQEDQPGLYERAVMKQTENKSQNRTEPRIVLLIRTAEGPQSLRGSEDCTLWHSGLEVL